MATILSVVAAGWFCKKYVTPVVAGGIETGIEAAGVLNWCKYICPNPNCNKAHTKEDQTPTTSPLNPMKWVNGEVFAWWNKACEECGEPLVLKCTAANRDPKEKLEMLLNLYGFVSAQDEPSDEIIQLLTHELKKRKKDFPKVNFSHIDEFLKSQSTK